MFRRLIYETFTKLASLEASELERASKEPRREQVERLLEIIFENRGTEFSNEHALHMVRSYKDFTRSVPIRDYAGHAPYIDRMTAGQPRVLTRERPLLFAATSGTTDKPKLIPVTRPFVDEFRRASQVSCVNLYRQFPAMADGKSLAVVSPAVQGKTPAGIPTGSISGFLYQSEPDLVKREVSAIPYEVLAIPDYETRYYCILRIALVLPITSIYTLNPSTIDLLVRQFSKYRERLARDVYEGTCTAPGPLPENARGAMKPFLHPDRLLARLLSDPVDLRDVWKNLSVISCWTKGAAAFYLQPLNERFPGVPVCDITYGASEGRGSVFLGDNKQMLSIRSHFFEFIPEEEIDRPNPSVLLCDELEVGKLYYVLMTTSGGLYRYNIGDVIKVTGFHNKTPLIEFCYKGGNVFSFSGEKVTELQVTQAMSTVVMRDGVPMRFFVVVPRFCDTPYYELKVEAPADFIERRGDALAEAFDRELAQLNCEYREKRKSGRLAAPRTSGIEMGRYETYRKQRVGQGAPDAQIKVTHFNPDVTTLAFFEAKAAG